MSAREAILRRVRASLEGRDAVPHPGAFHGWRPGRPGPTLETFGATLRAAGGEVVPCPDLPAALDWVRGTVRALGPVALGEHARALFGDDPPGESADPAHAAVGVSVARSAVAETGSLVLSSRDGRRAQLLPGVHVVLVSVSRIHPTLTEALTALGTDLPSAVGLHSGPSKSADIGQILVKGVHGPGRLIAVVVGAEPVDPT